MNRMARAALARPSTCSRKFFCPLLKPKTTLLIFLALPNGGVRAPRGPGPGDGHRSCPVPLVTILLFGGFGYAHLRLLSPLAFDHWLRPPF